MNPEPKLMACARDVISEGEICVRLSKHSFAVRHLMKGLALIPKNALG